jgi:hypothetical protein
MSKKDYVDSWYSEMHETFCDWNFNDWKSAVEAVGFNVLPASHAYRNDWLVENRYKNKIELYEKVDDSLVLLDFPVTNLLLIAEKSA